MDKNSKDICLANRVCRKIMHIHGTEWFPLKFKEIEKWFRDLVMQFRTYSFFEGEMIDEIGFMEL